MTSTVLSVRNLCRNFGTLRAVDDLSFDVERGQIFGFIGPNGAGKTTTMRVLATLDLPDDGDAWVGGLSVLVEPRKVRNRVGFMSDHFEPYAGLDVIQYLDFFARAYGLTGKKRLQTVRSVASFCGLTGFRNRAASALSKGMGQRLHLAKTLLHDPQLLILDEPAAGLDPRARIEFRALLKELAATGKSILISSHILSELGETCDGVVVIERGKRVVAGQLEDIAKELKTHHRMRMKVLDGGEGAERFLLTWPKIESVLRDDLSLHFDFTGDAQELAELLAQMIQKGHQVVEFREMEADLEEIFLQSTKGQLH